MSSFRELRRISCPAITIAGLSWLVAIAVTTSVAAQECVSDPAFEVASVKPVDHWQGAQPRIDAGRVIYPYITLRALIIRAYSLKGYQLDGPDWLSTAHYEAIAKIPDGCGTRELPAMLRHLLQERFGLQVHEESRDQSVYALVADRNGPKLKKSDAPMPEKGTAQGPASTVRISSSGRLTFRRATLGQLAEALSGSLGKPVLDMTGINGEYDMELDVDPPRALRVSTDTISVPEQTEPMASPIHSGLRALGLRLEPRKAPIQHIVVDRAEKIPSPN